MTEDLFSNDLVNVYLDEEIPVMIHRWKDSPDSQSFRDQLISLQQEYLKQKGKYPNLMWLADTKFLGERSPDDEDWLEKVWEKLLFEDAGVKVHAVILADNIFSDYSMEQFKIMARNRYEEVGVHLGVFMDEESAYRWLRTFR